MLNANVPRRKTEATRDVSLLLLFSSAPASNFKGFQSTILSSTNLSEDLSRHVVGQPLHVFVRPEIAGIVTGNGLYVWEGKFRVTSSSIGAAEPGTLRAASLSDFPAFGLQLPETPLFPAYTETAPARVPVSSAPLLPDEEEDTIRTSGHYTCPIESESGDKKPAYGYVRSVLTELLEAVLKEVPEVMMGTPLRDASREARELLRRFYGGDYLKTVVPGSETAPETRDARRTKQAVENVVVTAAQSTEPLYLSTVDDPEANGRQPQAGESRWILDFPLSTGRRLFLTIGRKTRDAWKTMLQQEEEDYGTE
jgi:hypothetical protein